MRGLIVFFVIIALLIIALLTLDYMLVSDTAPHHLPRNYYLLNGRSRLICWPLILV